MEIPLIKVCLLKLWGSNCSWAETPCFVSCNKTSFRECFGIQATAAKSEDVMVSFQSARSLGEHFVMLWTGFLHRSDCMCLFPSKFSSLLSCSPALFSHSIAIRKKWRRVVVLKQLECSSTKGVTIELPLLLVS